MILAALFTLASARTYRLEPIVVKALPPFSELKKSEASELLDREVEYVLRASLELESRIVVAPGESAERTVKIELRKVGQKNRSRTELLNNPNGGASVTEVTVGLSLNDSPFQELKGTAKGAYFGTTNRRTMVGSPDAEALEIRTTNRERARAVGRAIWDAVKLNVLRQD